MADEKRDVLEVLKFELSFLEQGGYGRSVRTPWKATSVFQDSPSCLNFNDPARPHACSECLLTDFVPLAGSRRRSYLLLTTAVAFKSVHFGAIELLDVPH